MTLYKVVLSYLIPVAVATTTIITPQTGAFPLGVGEQTIPNYLVAEYVETVEYTPEQALNAVFGEGSIMTRIAKCESNLTHFTASGEVLIGITGDVGLLQIAPQYHLITAQKHDIDIYSLYGNIEYAKILYDTYGTQPWSASSKCWSKG